MAGSTSPQRASSTNAALWYLIYNSLITFLSVLTVVFWTIGSKRPLLYPVEFGEWLRANPKIGTIIWTACGSVSAAVFLLLLKCCLLLMVRQKARAGATFSTIEGWNRCANEQPLFNTKRLRLSGFTIINWLVALTLTTAFTTLLTPTNVLVSEDILGDELDYTAHEFLDWYNLPGPGDEALNRLQICERITYTSSTGSVNFPTCPHTHDPIGCISAGVSATQQSLGLENASVRVINSLFQGSTGGVLPTGFRGIPAFNNVQFKDWDPSTRYSHFNYTLSQQGLSAEVSCHETLDTPIESNALETLNVTNSAFDQNTLQLVEFFIQKDFCNSKKETWVVPSIGVVAHFLCQPDRNIKKYEFYLQPFLKYDYLPKITCSIEPIITNNLVAYSTATGLFTSKVVETIGSSAVPNETVPDVNNLLKISITTWGSALIDSILSLNTTSDGSGNFTYPVAVESALRGLVEYAGTYSRMYYSAKFNTTGRSTVNGTYTTSRVGYHQTQPTALLIVLHMILYLVSMAGWYTYKGMKTGLPIDDDFDPTNSTALVTAAALGASENELDLKKLAGLNQHYEMVKDFKVKYDEGKGFMLVTEQAVESSSDSSSGYSHVRT